MQEREQDQEQELAEARHQLAEARAREQDLERRLAEASADNRDLERSLREASATKKKLATCERQPPSGKAPQMSASGRASQMSASGRAWQMCLVGREGCALPLLALQSTNNSRATTGHQAASREDAHPSGPWKMAFWRVGRTQEAANLGSLHCLGTGA